MSRFLVISDVHAHPFSYGAEYVPYLPFNGLINSRLVDTVTAIEEVAAYATDNNVCTVLFGGDLFHTRQAVKTVAYTLVSHALTTHFVNKGIEVIMIPGNHDYADRSGAIHSLQSFKNMGFTVLDTVTAYESESVVVVSVPYTDDRMEASTRLALASSLGKEYKGDKPIVLLAHLGVQGAKVGSDYVLICPSDIQCLDIDFDSFDMCLFGHYHQHQQIAKNAWFIGALTQQNWSDTNGYRGFLDISIGGSNANSDSNKLATCFPIEGGQTYARDGKAIKGIRVETGAPKFLLFDDPKDITASPKDFVMITTDKIITQADQEEIKQSHNIQNLSIKVIADKPTEVFKTPVEKLNILSSLKPWVEQYAQGRDEEQLLQFGKNLLAQGIANEV